MEHLFFDGDDDKPENGGTGPETGDYTPPQDLPIPGETEALPEREL